MPEWDQKLEAALRSLAETAYDRAIGVPAAEIRRRAQRRRRRRAFLVPTGLLTVSLAGGTVYGLAAERHPPRTPSRAAASAPAAPDIPVPSARPSHRPSAAAAAASTPAGPTRPATPRTPAPRLLKALCQISRTHPVLGYVTAVSAGPFDRTVTVVPAACTPDPTTPGGDRVAPSGAARQVPLAADPVITLIAPGGQGAVPIVASITQLVTDLNQDPGRLFGMTLNPAGQVTELDQIDLPGQGGRLPG